MDAIVVRARDLLQGEPLRAIVYGSAVMVWLVTHAAIAAGVTRLGPAVPLDQALIAATGAAAFLTEWSRRHVTPAG